MIDDVTINPNSPCSLPHNIIAGQASLILERDADNGRAHLPFSKFREVEDPAAFFAGAERGDESDKVF